MTQTEHPKFVILETLQGRIFKARSKISVNNFDIFAYINSKFVYIGYQAYIAYQDLTIKFYINIME